MASLPQCPASLKQLQHYLKLASDYDKREPVVSYWARLYTLQTALKIDRKSPEARALLTGLMDYLENFKKEHRDNDSVTNDVAGQALVENVAHKLFMWADGEDRAARFNKNVVKVFYTAGLLFDVCEVFGEVPEEVTNQRKYAKWKATYIHNCLKNGETPIPGPMAGDDEGLGEDVGGAEGGEEAGAVGGAALGWSHPQPHPGLPSVPGEDEGAGLPSVPSSSPPPPPTAPRTSYPPPPQVQPPAHVPAAAPARPPAAAFQMPEATGGSVPLTPDMVAKAQKYCKWAVSALDYDDSQTAIGNLQKALTLLSTGHDS
ncbi:vacuolar protein sorting-associated protein VTA1 homolog [Eriocheir sinensis]|uniref:vacuolar protein sorting-associated protein VTA1 homolog n=1 Tax=Eriocheir sinensis TaxID=95602 RepID=UPI0021C8E019|nr:vacuolar protein sorting-associated protein VTA1 homolog [Eriocheir sinensis]XP_050710666.1 vacuolar protein sorting-associated protein VTA1 homolog [Eriocheir sinensis]XP_050710667.1 vacuolar protein sorting-associated protein VTA1 homolog [Eriocheir sinensis]XP_050710668.1 vacuolar protein sorting-associated protein VTA1 homolog [Eriocheir sinensis]XP_050710669.1 vacuolar protein sorting-associated protein VTA1 homolog [Eriocheir sinensis]XP_050710670.1 vacuolar protein sorting-associated